MQRKSIAFKLEITKQLQCNFKEAQTSRMEEKHTLLLWVLPLGFNIFICVDVTIFESF
jgi:hypothetical protein